MKARPTCWIDRVDVFGSELVSADRRHLAYLRAQLGETEEAIAGSHRCIAESLVLLGKLSRMIEKDQTG